MSVLNKFFAASVLSLGIAGFVIAAPQEVDHYKKGNTYKSAQHKSFHHNSVAFQLLNPKVVNNEITLNNEQKLLFKDALDFHKSMNKSVRDRAKENHKAQLTLITTNTPDLEAVFKADNLAMEDFLLKTKQYQAKLLRFWNSLDKKQKDKLIKAYQDRLDGKKRRNESEKKSSLRDHEFMKGYVDNMDEHKKTRHDQFYSNQKNTIEGQMNKIENQMKEMDKAFDNLGKSNSQF